MEFEEKGSEGMMGEVLLSVAMVWLGTNGGSLTYSKTNDVRMRLKLFQFEWGPHPQHIL